MHYGGLRVDSGKIEGLFCKIAVRARSNLGLRFRIGRLGLDRLWVIQSGSDGGGTAAASGGGAADVLGKRDSGHDSARVLVWERERGKANSSSASGAREEGRAGHATARNTAAVGRKRPSRLGLGSSPVGE